MAQETLTEVFRICDEAAGDDVLFAGVSRLAMNPASRTLWVTLMANSSWFCLG